MRYLKLYENYTNNIEELDNFCEENLSFLIDNGFSAYATSNNIVIKKGNRNILMDRKEFSWNDVKEEIIPFLEKLNEYYNIIDRVNNYQIVLQNPSYKSDFSHITDYYKYEDVINDVMDNSYNKQCMTPLVNLNNLTTIVIGIKEKNL